MIALRFLLALLLLALIVPAHAYSQGTGDAPSPTPEFFSYVTEPIQRLKSAEVAGHISFGGIHQEPSSEFWWMPADGQGVFVAKAMRADLSLFRINVDSAEVSQIGSVPANGYIAVRGHGSTVYLLRVDTANSRYRLIADVYSVQQARIVATRTLLDLPLWPSKFPTKIIWDDRLQAVAVSLNDRPGVPSSARELHVVNLQTGHEHTVRDEGRDASWPGLSELIPLRFDASGHRLFLARRNRSAESPGSPLYDFALESGAIKPIGTNSLPARPPISINHDASLAVYANAKGYEIWRVNDSVKIGSATRGPSAFSGLGRPLLKFVGKGSVVALSDGQGMRLLAGFAEIPAGQEPAVFEHLVLPREPNQPSFEFVPIFLSGHADKAFLFGLFSTSPEDLGPGPWIQQVKIGFPGEETGSAQVDPIKRLQHVSLPSDEWTPWATGPNYQRLFNEVTSRNKYPVSVYGRLRNGRMQFRGRFFDKPEKLDFITHHGITEEVLRQKELPYRSRGFQEFWRHTFVDQSGTKSFNVIWKKRLDEPPVRGRNKRFRSPEETRSRRP